VFKDNVSQDDIKKYAEDLKCAGTLSHSKTLTMRHTHNSQSAIGGEVTNYYDSVLNGFAAVIPDSFMSKLQSLQSDNVIDYIGKTFCTSEILSSRCSHISQSLMVSSPPSSGEHFNL
jgi:hypothetical protein